MAFNAATDIRLPFVKYSYATGQHSDGTVTWTHLRDTNLYVIVEGTVQGQLSMRIVQVNTVLV